MNRVKAKPYSIVPAASVAGAKVLRADIVTAMWWADIRCQPPVGYTVAHYTRLLDGLLRRALRTAESMPIV